MNRKIALYSRLAQCDRISRRGNRCRYPNVYLASTFPSINNSTTSSFLSTWMFLPFLPSFLPFLSLYIYISLSPSLSKPSISLFVFPPFPLLPFNESSGLTRALLLSNGCPLFTRLRNSLRLYNGCLTRWVVFAIDRSCPAQASHPISIVFQRITRLPHTFDRDSWLNFFCPFPFRSFGPFVINETLLRGSTSDFKRTR